MPDQTNTPTTKRMTTAEVATLAQATDGRLDDLSAVVTDVATRLQDLQGATGPTTSGPSHDQVDARIQEALSPLHDEVHELRQRSVSGQTGGMDRMAGVLARLEDAERKVAAVDTNGLVATVAQELHPTLSEVRKRLDAVEAATRALDGDPASHALAEDALADQIQAAVERALTDLSTTSEVSVARVDQLAREFTDLRQHVETHGTHVTRALVNEVAAQVAPTAVAGMGAARKVLELMRAVTHIGKEKEANLGQGGRFKFRGVDDAMDAVGHAMREVGLILGTKILQDESHQTPITKGGTNKDGTAWENTVVWTSTKLTVRYTFTDPEDGSSHSLEMTGEGRDASDKSTSKAASMALKYGLFQALMIPVNGLDDSDAAPPQVMTQERAPERPASQPSAGSPQANLNQDNQRPTQDKSARAVEALQAIRNVYRVEGGPQAQYNRLVQIMNQVKAEQLLDFSVEGSTLNQHGQAAMRTLQAPAPEPPDQDGSNYGETGGY